MPELLNPYRSGVVYDDEGRSLGGGERIEVDEVDAVGQAAVDARHLMLVEAPSEDETDGASQPE